MSKSDVYGDRVHRFAAPAWVIFDALTVGQDEWVVLAPGETAPKVIESERPRRVVWSSLWPVGPDDTVEFRLSRYGAGTEVRFVCQAPRRPTREGSGLHGSASTGSSGAIPGPGSTPPARRSPGIRRRGALDVPILGG